MESPALDAIRNGMRTFAEQAAPTNTGCALQSIFLQNVLLEYQAISEHPHQTSHRQQDHGYTRPSHESSCQNPATSNEFRSTTDNRDYHRPGTSSVPLQYVEEADMMSRYDDQDPAPIALSDLPLTNLDFTDNDSWALIFANAGFNIDQGTFILPV